MSETADNIISIQFDPDSNRNLLQYSVLRIRVRLRCRQGRSGGLFRVVIRTNLNQSHRIRRQIIDLVEKGQSYSTDFHDIPARYNAAQDEYQIDVLLNEVGFFEFKVRVESTQRHRPWVKWAEGENVGISVTPLEYARNNSIYCAFIRQFGDNKNEASLKNEQMEENICQLEQQGAYVLPPGGDFGKFMESLPFIVEELGMKIIHLLPINPVPTSYGRMGMYGSPYATTDYFGIDHTYGTFSHYKTIEDQFVDLTSTVHGLGAKVFLDMVINHTGWASSILFTHREWIKVDQDRRIISPGAWGVVWGDLVELDYKHKALWKYMAGVFLAWCHRGIDGFRLDAGYMVPLEAWRYIIARVRQEFPNTLFLLEGLGGPWETTERLLTDGQMNWAYSELFQNYGRQEIVDYLDYAQRISWGKGVMVHYAETHDNDRLAKKGKVYALTRLRVCAFTSFTGAWGFANGVEWLATEKIDVHRNTGLNWGCQENLVEEISQINKILADNPAFWDRGVLATIETGNEDVLGFIRSDAEQNNVVVCLINLNSDKAGHFKLDLTQSGFEGLIKADVFLHELMGNSGDKIPAGQPVESELEPGGCLLYRLESAEQPGQAKIPALFDVSYERISLIYQILLSRFAPHEVGRIDQDKLLREVTNYRKFIVLVNRVSLEFLINHDIAKSLEKIEPDDMEHYSAVWTFRESSKEFIISGDKWLVIHTFVPCTAYLKTSDETDRIESIPSSDGIGHLSCFPPKGENKRMSLAFNWKIERQKKIIRQQQAEQYPILSVPSGHKTPRFGKIYPIRLEKNRLRRDYATVLLTDGAGALCQCPAKPGILNSKYDSFLAITPEKSRPTFRLSLVKTIKETVQVGQKFFDLDESFLRSFTRYPQPLWKFTYDDGQYYIKIERSLVMPYQKNTVLVRYKLREANTPIILTCKCYVESRDIHHQAKVQQNEEMRRDLPRSCRGSAMHRGVVFTPQQDITVHISAKKGEFIEQPHWIFDMEFPQDAERGLEATGDAFSPGIFNFELHKGNSAVIMASVDKAAGAVTVPAITAPAETAGIASSQDMEASAVSVPVAIEETEVESPPPLSAHAAVSDENKRVKELLELVPVEQARRDPLVKMLACAMDQFLVRLDHNWLLMTGYPWLGIGVRDSLYCVGGLLAAGRGEAAHDIILQAAGTASGALLADWIGNGPVHRGCAESSLRLFLAAHSYATSTGEASFLDRAVLNGGVEHSLREVLVNIYECLRDGREKDGPELDASSGFLFSPAGFSWMNTSAPCATPRSGFPVEIQALWYKALAVLGEICPSYASEVGQLRGKIEENFMPQFWNDKRGYLSDFLIAEKHGRACKAPAETSLRFNQLAAINASLVPLDSAHQIIDVITRRLLIPAGVRSLSEEPLTVPLKIVDDRGVLLADPRMPYQPRCAGGETMRRVAYHNGTAWPSAYPGFIEAQASVFRFTDLAVKQALAFFEPICTHLSEGGIGTLSQMKDGNYPHRPRGCYAYALSVAEAVRVYMLLKYR